MSHIDVHIKGERQLMNEEARTARLAILVFAYVIIPAIVLGVSYFTLGKVLSIILTIIVYALIIFLTYKLSKKYKARRY